MKKFTIQFTFILLQVFTFSSLHAQSNSDSSADLPIINNSLIIDTQVIDTAKAISMAKDTLAYEVSVLGSISEKLYKSLFEDNLFPDSKEYKAQQKLRVKHQSTYNQILQILCKYIVRKCYNGNGEYIYLPFDGGISKPHVSYRLTFLIGDYTHLPAFALRQNLLQAYELFLKNPYIRDLSNNDLFFPHVLSTLPTKTIQVSNPYYTDSNFHWLDTPLAHNLSFEKHSTSFPVADIYYTSSHFPNFKFRYNSVYYNAPMFVYDSNDNLVAIRKTYKTPGTSPSFLHVQSLTEDEYKALLNSNYTYKISLDPSKLLEALFRYDISQNAHNINNYPLVKELLELLLQDSSGSQTYTVSEYTNISQLTQSIQFSPSDSFEKYIHDLKNLTYSDLLYSLRNKYDRDTCNQAILYLRQLLQDYSYSFDALLCTRLDGFNFLVTDPNSSLQVQFTLSQSTESKYRVISHYKVLQK